MDGTAKLLGEQRPKVKGEQYLGPAVVTEIEGRGVVIELPDGQSATAQMALAYSYQPVAGDVLLVIGKDEVYYGIGVLHGTGKVVLAFQGDVDVRAAGGSLRLSGATGVQIAGPEGEVHAGTLRTIAGALVQKLDSVVQRVNSLLSVHAGKSHTVVDGASFLQAESGTILTRDVMTINGKQVHLG